MPGLGQGPGNLESLSRHWIPRSSRGMTAVGLDPPVNPSTSLRAVSSSNGPGDDDITAFVTFYKGLFMIPIYKKKFYYSEFIPTLKSGVFC